MKYTGNSPAAQLLNSAIFDTSTKLCRITSIHILLNSRYSANANFLFSASKQQWNFQPRDLSLPHEVLLLAFLYTFYCGFYFINTNMNALGLQLLCFYHLFLYHNLLGNYCIETDFSFPSVFPPRVFRFALASRSRDSFPDPAFAVR